MVTLIFLMFAIILQFVGAIVAISLTKKTKYSLSWILLSIGFLVIAIQRFLEFIPYVWKDFKKDVDFINTWLGITSAMLFASGVILIQQIFVYLRKVDKARTETEKRVLNAIIKTEENERRRFAKDLHDGLGPLLSTVKLAVSSVAQMENNPKILEIIQNTDLVITEAIKNVKEISNILSPHILENFGIVSAIKSFISKINMSKNHSINFKTNMGSERFDYNTEVVLYRVVCELLNNTVKHAGASQIDIELTQNEDLLTLIFSDNGKGFDVNEVLSDKNSGMGYNNILSRIKSIKGIINIESEKDKGTKVIIVINTKNA